MFSTLDKSFDYSSYGSKAANLSKCLGHSKLFRVPNGFASTTKFFKCYTGPFQSYIDHLIERCNIGDYIQVNKTSKEISALFWNQTNIPLVGLEQLMDNLSALTNSWIVRSSSSLEDRNHLSFAGVYESFEENDANKLIEKIKLVFASLYSPQAIIYRHRHKVSQRGLTMSVLIQDYIKGDHSGVLFTRHPDTSEKVMHVVSDEGSCNNIVKGLVIPSEYLLKNFNVLETTHLRVKEGTTTLKKDVLFQLEMVGKELEQIFRRPLDIEWTVKDDILFLLQVRPITVQPTFVKRERTKSKAALLTGMAIRSLASARIVKGRTYHYQDGKLADSTFKPGDIIVCVNTTPAMEPLMACAGGLITDHGARTSHAAIRSREMNLPAIIGTMSATTKLKDKQNIELDFNENPYEGRVY